MEEKGLEVIEVANIYEGQIVIPDNKPKNKFILCPIGLVGAGKTTVVKPLSKSFGLVRISGDEIRKLLKEREFDPHTESNRNIVRDVARKLIDKYLDLEYSVCLDSDCIHQETQDFLKDLENSRKIKLVWIHINTPEEFILHKLNTYKGDRLETIGLIKNYHERKPLHENLNFPFVYTFDTSKENLPEQINEAAEIIRKFTGN